MSKHTPGPWVTTCASWKVYITHQANISREETILQEIASCGDEFDDETWPNAILMAAAPDLLEALEAALTILTDSVGDFDYDKALSAIAKAKGEPCAPS